MSSYQLYATIPQTDWAGDLKSRFPGAPLVNGYRVLVFTNFDYHKLAGQYGDKEFIELQSDDIISAIESGQDDWLVCDVENIRIVINYFNQPQSAETI